MGSRYNKGDKVIVPDKSLGYGDAVGTIIGKINGDYRVRFQGLPEKTIEYEGYSGDMKSLETGPTGEYVLSASTLKLLRRKGEPPSKNRVDIV